MYDPIPWYLTADEARNKGFRASGWYIMDGKKPVVGPCESPEDCIVAIGDRNEAREAARRLA